MTTTTEATATESTTIACYCGKSFEWTRIDGYSRKPSECPECIEAESQRNWEIAADKLEDTVFQLTPKRYNATDIEHPDFNRGLWEKVAAWEYTNDRPWLGIVGETGKGKSRCAYLALPEIAVGMLRKSGETCWRLPILKAITAYDFTAAVMNQYSDDKQEKAAAKAYLSSLKRVDLLLFDDLGKARNTPAVSAELFALFDSRHEANRLTIWTSNLSPEGIVAGMPEEIGAPLAGRIRECSTIFNCR